MLQPAPFSAAELTELVAEHYQRAATSSTFLPLGSDSASFVYRVETLDAAYFLKLRTHPHFQPASVVVPEWLSRQGVNQLIAPLRTAAGQAWVTLDAFVLTLYPFVQLHSAASAGLALTEWQKLGAVMRQIHAAALPDDVRALLAEETFIPSPRALLPQIEAALALPRPDDPAHTALRTLWHERAAQIAALVAAADALAAVQQQRSHALALCHADLHTWNINVDPTGRAWIVDWDEVVLAPRERDLMFVIGGIARHLVRDAETAAFLSGYGPVEVDPALLVYYRYAWAVQDLLAWSNEALLLPERTLASRMAAVAAAVDLFAPGSIVDIATADPPLSAAC